ncbi:MAG: DUF1217 domain-containing protein [Pseudomonadota bacterium]
MPLPPAIPLTGIGGLRFLDRTYDRQFEIFNRSPDIAREIEYFEQNAGSITSVDDLMADRRILNVVLGAFGLDEDVGKNAFIRKVVEEGTIDPEAFANRLVDPRYREMSEFLALGDLGNAFERPSEITELVDRYKERQFELSVGDVDFDLRLALNFRREAEATVNRISDPDSAWLGLLGSRPLRSVLEGALNLPTEFGTADLDQQVEEVKRRMDNLFDVTSPTDLLESEVLDQVVDRFLANSQITNGVLGPSVRGATALSLLQFGGVGTIGGSNLFASNFI